MQEYKFIKKINNKRKNIIPCFGSLSLKYCFDAHQHHIVETIKADIAAKYDIGSLKKKKKDEISNIDEINTKF